MKTLFDIFDATAMVIGFMACPVLVQLLLDAPGWRSFIQKQSFGSSAYMLGFSMRKLRAACALSMVAGASIGQITQVNRVRLLDWYLQPLKVTWWIDALGFVVMGLAVCSYLVIRRRTPCLLIDDLAIEFHRTTATTAQVHIQRRGWWAFHPLGEGAPPMDLSALPSKVARHPLGPALGAIVHPATLKKLQLLGITRLELYSPLISDAAMKRLLAHWGNAIHGFPVKGEQFRLDWTESLALLAVLPLAWSTWLRKHSRWIGDKSLLIDRITPSRGLRPECNGLVVSL